MHISSISPEKHGHEVDFLPADKHKSILWVANITLGVQSKTCPNNPKWSISPKWSKSPLYLFNIIRKMGRMKLIFCLQIKVFSDWYCHFRFVWLGMPQLPKITTFLLLCNIVWKKWVMKLVSLHAEEHKSFL